MAVLSPRPARVGAVTPLSVSEMWENWSWFRGPWACDKAGTTGFSDTWTSRPAGRLIRAEKQRQGPWATVSRG